jgi:pilus assembly protein CpaB
MKQKNLILIAVAVVCGLGAAFLTTQMSAKPANKPVDMVKVPVAAVDIPIGTRFSKTDLEKYFTLKDFPKDAVPPGSLQNVEELDGKRILRQIAKGNLIDNRDVNATGFIEPPAGTVLMSTPISLDQAASGFAIPGSRVIVMAVKRSAKKNKEFVFPLLLDSLVLAVNTNLDVPASKNGGSDNSESRPAGFNQVSMMSLAVTPTEAQLLTMAAQGGATLRMGLPGMNEEAKQKVIEEFKKEQPTVEQMFKIFADEWDDDKKKEASPEAPKIEMVKVILPKDAIETGVKLTAEDLDAKFKIVDFPKEHVPANAILEAKELAGKYTKTDLQPGFVISKQQVSNSPPKKEENPVAVKGEVAAAKTEASVAEYAVAQDKIYMDGGPAPKPKAEYTYVTIYTPQGKKVHKYEVTKKGNVFVGEVTPGLEDEKPEAGSK